MSFFCYDTMPQQNKSSGGINLDRIDPNKCWLDHYSNSLFLQFMISKGTTQEKIQASNELVICERKMKWHEQHPSFNIDYISVERKKVEKNWLT